VLLALNGLADLDILLGLGLASAAKGLTVVGLVPLTEGGGIDLDDGGAGQSVGADELVVGRVEGDTDDADLAGDTLAAPGAGFETETTELAVTTTGADEVDTLGADSGVGGLTALLESSVCWSGTCVLE
jgi:hypothetical protein